MKRSDISQPPCYYDKYINCAADVHILQAFADSLAELKTLDLGQLNRIGEAVYAPGKWTVKDIFQHLIDVEHIPAYRSLRIGRNDQTKLPGFEESVLAANVSTASRSLERIIRELKIARQATAFFRKDFSPISKTVCGKLRNGFRKFRARRGL
jgi:hypothetical protein